MSRRLPPLNSLRAFEAAARHLSFTRAAEELNVTQAAIGHQVKSLESRLAMKLFRRRGRGLVLSHAGQIYALELGQAFDVMDRATLQLTRHDRAGGLTVSMLPSFAAKWFVPKLGAFRARHPDIDMRVAPSITLTDFGREDVDVAIRYGNGHWPEMAVEHFLTEDVFPVCSPQLPGLEELRQPQDIGRQTLLHDDLREDWRMWLLAAGVEGVDPERGPSFADSAMVVQAAVEGLGLALARSALAAADLAAGRLVRPFDVSLPAEFAYYIVCPPAHLERPAIKAFRDWLVETVRTEQEPAASH